MKILFIFVFAIIAHLGDALGVDLNEAYKAYSRKDYDVAIKDWRTLAMQGDSTAQYNLGNMYVNGLGVKVDNVEAYKWFKLAALQGNSDAQLNLGILYENGKGIKQNLVEAVKWFRN